MGIQIRGLVKAFRSIRSALQVGLLPEETALFREQVQALLSQVEGICEEHGASPDDLPAPSRNAYHFLRQIDLSQIPTREAGAPVPPSHQTFHISHVVKAGSQLAHRMWQRREQLCASVERRRTLLTQIARHCETIERLSQQHQTTPAALELPSRQVYCWLKFLSVPETLEAHLDALVRASSLAAPFVGALGGTLDLHMMHMNSLWRMRPRGQLLRVRCNQGFLYAPDDVWQAMFGSMMSQRTPRRRTLVSEFLESETYASVLFELESFVEGPEQAKGVVYDLDECFQRVNRAYFSPPLARPKLHWSHTPTTSKCGHYQSSTDTIMISASLDREEVPAFVLEFVMYHEMLHKQHGVEIIEGRRFAHTPAFREDERRFARYEEAEAFLRTWSHKLQS